MASQPSIEPRGSWIESPESTVAALSGDRHVPPTTLAAISLREHHWLVTVSKLHRAAARTTVQLEKLGVRALVGGPGRTLDELQRLARQEQHTTPDSNR